MCVHWSDIWWYHNQIHHTFWSPTKLLSPGRGLVATGRRRLFKEAGSQLQCLVLPVKSVGLLLSQPKTCKSNWIQALIQWAPINDWLVILKLWYVPKVIWHYPYCIDGLGLNVFTYNTLGLILNIQHIKPAVHNAYLLSLSAGAFEQRYGWLWRWWISIA